MKAGCWLDYQLIDRALSVLGTLPETPYRDAMSGLSEFVLIRGS